MAAHFDTSQIRALGEAWLHDGQNLTEYLQTMHTSVWNDMGTGWTGKAGQAAQVVWNGSGTGENNVWHEIWQSAWVATQVGQSIIDYADELEKTVKEINTSRLTQALASIFGLVLNIASLGLAGIIGQLATKIGAWLAGLAASSKVLAGIATTLGEAAAFVAATGAWGAVTINNDLLSQLLATAVTNGPFAIDWVGEAMNLGLGLEAGVGEHLGPHLTSGITNEKLLNVSPSALGEKDLPNSVPHVEVPTFSDTNSTTSWRSSSQTLVSPSAEKFTGEEPAKYGLQKYDLENYSPGSLTPDVAVKTDASPGTKDFAGAPGPDAARAQVGSPSATTPLPGGVRPQPQGPRPMAGSAHESTPGSTRPAGLAPEPGRPQALVRPPAGGGRGQAPANAGRGDTAPPAAGNGRSPVNLDPAPRSAQADTRPAAPAAPAATVSPHPGGTGDDAQLLASSATSRPGDGPHTLTTHSEGPGSVRPADSGAGPVRPADSGAGLVRPADSGAGLVRPADPNTGADFGGARRVGDSVHGAGVVHEAVGGGDAAPPRRLGQSADLAPAGGVRPGRGAEAEAAGGAAVGGGSGRHGEPAPSAGSSVTERPAPAGHGPSDTAHVETSAVSGAHEGAGSGKDALATSAAEPHTAEPHNSGGHNARGHAGGSAGRGHDHGSAAADSHATVGGKPVHHDTAKAGGRGPDHKSEHPAGGSEREHKLEQWYEFQHEQARYHTQLLDAETHLESLHTQMRAAWERGAAKFAEKYQGKDQQEPQAGVNPAKEADNQLARRIRWDHAVKDVEWQWRADFTRQFREELNTAGQISSESFDKILRDADQNAYRLLHRADGLIKFDEKFHDVLEAHKANKYSDELPKFDRAPSDYVLDKELGIHVKNDAKAYGRPPEDKAFWRLRGGDDLPDGHEGNGPGHGPVDFFRDKSHDFNALEHYYINKREQLSDVLDASLDDAAEIPPSLPARLNKLLGDSSATDAHIDRTLHDLSRDFASIARREDDVQRVVEKATKMLAVEWEGPLRTKAVGDSARLDLARDLRALHDEVFVHRAGHEAVFGNGDGQGPGRQWILRSNHMARQFPERLGKAEFVHSQVEAEKAHAEFHLWEHHPKHALEELGEDGEQRLIGGYLKQVRKVAELYAARRQDNGLKVEATSAEWTGMRGQLRSTLPARFAHGIDAQSVLVVSAREFHGLVRRPETDDAGVALHDDTVSRLGGDFRVERITRFDELLAPEGHDTGAWLAHESHHEDAFHTDLGNLRRQAAEKAAELAKLDAEKAAAPDSSAPAPHDTAAQHEDPAAGAAEPKTAETSAAETSADQAPGAQEETQAGSGPVDLHAEVHRELSEMGHTASHTQVYQAYEEMLHQRPEVADLPMQTKITRLADALHEQLTSELHAGVSRQLPKNGFTFTPHQVRQTYEELLHKRSAIADLPMETKITRLVEALREKVPLGRSEMQEGVHQQFSQSGHTFLVERVYRAYQELLHGQPDVADLPMEEKVTLVAGALQQTMPRGAVDLYDKVIGQLPPKHRYTFSREQVHQAYQEVLHERPAVADLPLREKVTHLAEALQEQLPLGPVDLHADVQRMVHEDNGLTVSRAQVQHAYEELLHKEPGIADVSMEAKVSRITSVLEHSANEMFHVANKSLLGRTGHYYTKEIHQAHQELVEQHGDEFLQLSPANQARHVVAEIVERKDLREGVHEILRRHVTAEQVSDARAQVLQAHGSDFTRLDIDGRAELLARAVKTKLDLAEAKQAAARAPEVQKQEQLISELHAGVSRLLPQDGFAFARQQVHQAYHELLRKRPDVADLPMDAKVTQVAEALGKKVPTGRSELQDGVHREFSQHGYTFHVERVYRAYQELLHEQPDVADLPKEEKAALVADALQQTMPRGAVDLYDKVIGQLPPKHRYTFSREQVHQAYQEVLHERPAVADLPLREKVTHLAEALHKQLPLGPSDLRADVQVEQRQLLTGVKKLLGRNVTAEQVSYADALITRAYGANFTRLDIDQRAEFVAKVVKTQLGFTGDVHAAAGAQIRQEPPAAVTTAEPGAPRSAAEGHDQAESPNSTKAEPVMRPPEPTRRPVAMLGAPRSAVEGHDQAESSKSTKAKPIPLPLEPTRRPVDTETGFDGIQIRWDSETDPHFLATVQEQLQLLASKPTGKALLDKIAASTTTSKLPAWQQSKVKIERIGGGTVVGEGAGFHAHAGNVTKPINSEWATRPGKGTLSLVRYNPNAWETADGVRPPFIGLVHELIHTYRNLHGLSHPTAAVDEAQVVGFGEYADLEFTENKIREEHELPPRRAYAGTVGPELDDAHLPRTTGRTGPQYAGPGTAKGTGGYGAAGLLWNADAHARESELSEKHGVRIGPKRMSGGHFSHSVLDKIDAVLSGLPAEHIRDNPDLRYIEPVAGDGDGASSYHRENRGIDMVRPAGVPSWLYSRLDRGSGAQRSVMDKVLLSQYEGVPLAEALGVAGRTRKVMGGASNVLAHGNLLEWTIRHEIGHSISEPRAWFWTVQQEAAFGGWKVYAPVDGRVDDVAADVLRMAEIKDQADVLDDEGRTLFDVLAQELVPSRLRGEPERLAGLVEAFPGADERLRGGLERIVAFTRLALAQPWTLDDGGAATLSIGPRVHQINQQGDWVSYLRAERELHAVSNYQFSTPEEWFAETYAAFYDPVPGPRERLNPVVREWFETGLPQLLAQEHAQHSGDAVPLSPLSPLLPSPVPASPGVVGAPLVWASMYAGKMLFTPPEGVAIRVRGPRRSGKDGRTPNQLAAAAWQKLPEGTRQGLHKERLDISVDPLTLAETDPALHQALSNAGRSLEGGSISSKAARDAVLKALGKRDSLTRNYWDAQKRRDEALGVVVREELRVFRSGFRTGPVREQLVEGAIDGASPVEALRRLLGDHEGVVIGEEHEGTAARQLLADNMAELKTAGVQTVYLGSIRGDAYQPHLDQYLESGTMSPELQALIRHFDEGASTAGKGMQDLLEAARQHGVRVVGVDGYPARESGGGTDADVRYRRAAALNTYAAGVVRRAQRGLPDGGGYLVVVGAEHTGAHPGPEHRVKVHGQRFRPGDEFPGLDDLLDIPRVVQDQVGSFHPRPQSSRSDTGFDGAQQDSASAVEAHPSAHGDFDGQALMTEVPDEQGNPGQELPHAPAAADELPEKYAWLKRVNPERDKGGEFRTNCALAAIATDMSLAEGGVVQTSPSGLGEEGQGPKEDVTGLTIYLGRYRDMEPYPVDGPADVLAAMSRAEPGQRGMVVVEQPGSDIAHVVNVVRDDVEVVFLDGQAGTLVPAPATIVSFLPTTHGIPGFPLHQAARAAAPAAGPTRIGATGTELPLPGVLDVNRPDQHQRYSDQPESAESDTAPGEQDGQTLEQLLAEIERDLRRGSVSDIADPPASARRFSGVPQTEPLDVGNHDVLFDAGEDLPEAVEDHPVDHASAQGEQGWDDWDEDPVQEAGAGPLAEEAAEEATNGLEAFLLAVTPLQAYAQNTPDRTSPDVEIVLMAYPGAEDVAGLVRGDGVGHAFLAVRIPGREHAIVLGFGPADDVTAQDILTGSVAGGVTTDESSAVFDHSAEILMTYQINAEQLTKGYLYAVNNADASYHLLRRNCVSFALNFVAAAVGRDVETSAIAPSTLANALRAQSHRDWADNPHVVQLTPGDEAEVARAAQMLKEAPATQAQKARTWADYRVTLDHQRPLVVDTPTWAQGKQRQMLGHLVTLVAREFHRSGEQSALELSRSLGLKYGTLRDKAFALERHTVAAEALAPLQEFGLSGGGNPARSAEVVVMADAAGQPSVAVKVPGERRLVGFRFGPVHKRQDRIFLDSEPGTLFFEHSEQVHDLGFEILRTYRASAEQIAAGYAYATGRIDARYGSRPFSDALSEAGFLRGFLGAVTGSEPQSDVISVLRAGVNRSWVAAESPETVLRAADQAAFLNARNWDSYPTGLVEESMDWSRLRVSLDHQRPLVPGKPDAAQAAQANLLASFATLVADAYRSGGEAAALAESYRLGQAYGTLRVPATTAPSPVQAAATPATAHRPTSETESSRPDIRTITVGDDTVEMTVEGDFHTFVTDEGGTVSIGNDRIHQGALQTDVAGLVTLFRNGGLAGFRVHDAPGTGTTLRADERVLIQPPATSTLSHGDGTRTASSVVLATTQEEAERRFTAATALQAGSDSSPMAVAVIGSDQHITLTDANSIHVLGPVGAILVGREDVRHAGGDSRPLAGLAVSARGPQEHAGSSVAGVPVIAAGAFQQVPAEYTWLEQVNPYRDQGGEFLTNCVLTAIATDMSLADPQGGVFQAPPSGPGAEGQGLEGDDGTGLTVHLGRYRDMDPVPVDGPAAVIEAMSQAEPGQRGMVVVEAAGGGIAHVINVVRDGNGVVFLDGQAGTLAPVPATAVSFLPTTHGIPGFPLQSDPDTAPGAVARRLGSRATPLATVEEVEEPEEALPVLAEDSVQQPSPAPRVFRGANDIRLRLFRQMLNARETLAGLAAVPSSSGHGDAHLRGALDQLNATLNILDGLGIGAEHLDAAEREFRELQHLAGESGSAPAAASHEGSVTDHSASAADAVEAVDDAPPARSRPEIPWYVEGGKDGVRALGDMDVVAVELPADAAGQARAAVDALMPEAAGATRGLADQLAGRITEALGKQDPREWDQLLISGLTVSDSTAVVRVRFLLDGGVDAAHVPTGDGVLSEYRSKYGDISYIRADRKEQSSTHGLTGEIIRGLTGRISAVVPILKVTWTNSRISGSAIADEVQSGSRATNSARTYVDHPLRIRLESFTAEGAPGGNAEHQVAGMTVTSAHASAYAHDTAVDTGAATQVRNPAGAEVADFTIGAVDSEPLARDLLVKALASGAVQPKDAEKFMRAMMSEVVDEKSVRDRFPYIASDSYASNFINVPGLSGYVRLNSRLVSVQRIGTSTEGGVRNDIAETATVQNESGHHQFTGFGAGVEWAVKGVVASVHGTVGFSSAHVSTSGVQSQAKTAVLHNGPQTRYRVTLHVDGELHADRHLAVDAGAGRLLSDPMTPFGADLQAELLVPAHQAEAFEQALARGPEPLLRPYPSPAARARKPFADIVKRFPRMLTEPPVAKSPFAGWEERSHSELDLIGRLWNLRGPVLLTVPQEHVFGPAAQRWLADLQLRRDVTVIREGETPERVDFHVESADGAEPHVAVQHTPVTPENLSMPHFRHGFVLDGQGVSSGWRSDGRRVTAAPAPGRTVTDTAPAAQSTASKALTVHNLPVHPAGVLVALVAHPGTVETVSKVLKEREDGERAKVYRTGPGPLTEVPDLPQQGYVVNPVGRVVWGWQQPEAVHEWGGTDGTPSPGTAVHLLREAGRGGLQLVVHPDGPAARALHAAAEEVGALGPQERYDLQTRLARAQENDGAGLGALDPKDLLAALATHPNMRVVDGYGTILRGLNTRGRFAVRPQDDAALPATVVRTLPDAADPVMPVREEYAVRADGGLSRSVAFRPDGSVLAGHVRRPVHEADPLKETPELAARVGLGSAATKELPGAERVLAEARAIILDMLGDSRSGPRQADPASVPAVPGGSLRHSRHEGLSANERYQVDKELQTHLSLPKIRGARGRALDTGIRLKFTVDGKRIYEVEVKQTLLERPGDQPIATEAGVAIDHQTKGTQSAGGNVTRAWRAGVEGGVAVRVQTGVPGLALEVGDIAAEISYARSKHLQAGDATKGYSRLRAPNAEAARPEYAASYRITVTETRRVGLRRVARTVSRIIQGDGVKVPAIVHSAFRPAGDIPQMRTAFGDVSGTVGRTTVLEGHEYKALQAARTDFSATGTNGLHATFSGLKDTARIAAELVHSHGRPTQDAHVPRWADRAYVAQLEKAVTEGMLRSNLDRLLAPEGIKIPLPREFHAAPWRADVAESLTLRGFLVPADEAASFGAPKATVENYAETDLKVTESTTGTTEVGGKASVGVVAVVPGVAQEAAGGESRRNLTSNVGASVTASVSAIVKSVTRSTTDGSIDISLLTETTGQQQRRAHLVLELTSLRQPVNPPWLPKRLDDLDALLSKLKAGTAEGGSPTRHRTGLSTQIERVLVENSAELSLSRTLVSDQAATPGSREPLPREQQSRHIVRTDAAWGTGYVRKFEDQHAGFRGGTEDGAVFDVKAGGGVLGAVKEGLIRSGKVGLEHLNDTSDVWRGLAGKFAADEIGRHVHDLLDVGMVHRFEVPADWGSTRRVTVHVTAEAEDFAHLRSLDRGAVTFGGQSLKQATELHRRGWRAGAGGSVNGRYAQPGFGQVGGSAGFKTAFENSHEEGVQEVLRDIRRTAAQVRPKQAAPPPGQEASEAAEQAVLPNGPTVSEGEEFRGSLRIRIEIYADKEYIEPLRRVWHRDRPRPVVTLSTPVGGGEGAVVRTVVPQNFTEDGPPQTGRVLPGVPALDDPVRTTVVKLEAGAARPGKLEEDLGAKLQPIVFPDLRAVSAWGPVATLDPAETEAVLAGREPSPPHLAAFGPTTDLGVFTAARLTNRNVRDNIGLLFDHTFPLPSTGSEPMRLGVTASVVRPVGRSAGFSGLTFNERAEEPIASHEQVRSRSGGLGLEGGDSGGQGLADSDFGGENTKSNEGASGNYVEYNRQFSGQSYTYTGDFAYVVEGPRGYALRIDARRKFEGLLPEGYAVLLAERHPDRVVHPRAIGLPSATDQLPEAVGLFVRALTAPSAKPQQLHLVADLTAPDSRPAYELAARETADRARTPVDLALVHYSGSRATRVERVVFAPSESVPDTAARPEAVGEVHQPGPNTHSLSGEHQESEASGPLEGRGTAGVEAVEAVPAGAPAESEAASEPASVNVPGPARDSAATDARAVRLLGYRERIALAKRVWTRPVAEEAVELEKTLLQAGPASHSLVMGVQPGQHLWAVNIEGTIRWLERTGKATEAPMSAEGEVVSIDLDGTATLINVAPQLLQAGGGGGARFCEIRLGADLKHIV